MTSLVANATNVPKGAEFPSTYCEPHWYAVYTHANHEKRVAEQLARKFIEHFLPLYCSVRLWKDRRVRLQRPLLPGYIFVRLALDERLQVLQVSGVARLVGFSGTPTAIPEDDIETLKKLVDAGTHAEPYPYLAVGKRVRICGGALAGLEGIVVRRKGALRVVLSIKSIQRAILMDVDADAIVPF